jgi:hypothetical protein
MTRKTRDRASAAEHYKIGRELESAIEIIEPAANGKPAICRYPGDDTYHTIAENLRVLAAKIAHARKQVAAAPDAPDVAALKQMSGEVESLRGELDAIERLRRKLYEARLSPVGRC